MTQIARAGDADVFHTRLVHTLKVAQVGRRLSENLVATQPTEAVALGVEPEVVEAACLVHDLGHPPFGHLGEEVLNELVEKNGDPEGFEGNAQSFRVVTRLAVRFEEADGLDLTRATLAACIKYPWIRDTKNIAHSRKWGAYKIDHVDFEFARSDLADFTRTAEAELMDWADDIAYSVHDLEDFHRARLVPWRDIFSVDGCERLVSSALMKQEEPKRGYEDGLRAAHDRLNSLIRGTVGDILDQPYDGSRDQRRAIRFVTSTLIGRYVNAISLQMPPAPHVAIQANARYEVLLLKQVAADHIIGNPSLQAQQRGERRLLDGLFEDLFEAGSERFLSRRFEYMFGTDVSRARSVADCIASMTENEAVALYARLRGLSAGSVLDPIIR